MKKTATVTQVKEAAEVVNNNPKEIKTVKKTSKKHSKKVYEDKNRGVKVTVRSGKPIKEEEMAVVLHTTKELIKATQPSFWKRLFGFGRK